ncbi:MAG: branched-chain amino acid ABC transporter permease [Burkholderiales bacterium]|nr:branched-chain amino acid ABC transporter permease [Burkholderiales bacterium]
MEFFTLSLLNGLAYGLMLFMLSAGLTLVFSMMGVLNLAHASFYMLGAYLAYSLTQWLGFWAALVLAPVAVGLLGAGFEKFVLRRIHAHGHIAEMLVTFGLNSVLVELVQLVWGRGPVDYRIPAGLEGPLFSLWGTPFPAYRGFMVLVALAMLGGLWLVLARTRIGLVVQAALTHPDAVQALGHNVPRVFMGVFAGGAALAGLAGVVGGNAFVTEPGMAATVGSVVFVVVVVGGMGSLKGAFLASLLVGMLQTLAVGIDAPVLGWLVDTGTWGDALWRIKVSQIAPLLPYLLLVIVLLARPHGLWGRRAD